MRDRNDLAAALRQTDRLARSQAGPGYLGGRLALPQPVPGSDYTDALIDDDDGDSGVEDTDQPTWEDSDRYRLTATDIARGYFRHQLLHTEVVAAYEFTVLLNGNALDPSRYSLDPVAGVVIVSLAGWERARYRYRFLYAYTGEDVEPEAAPEPVAVPYTFVGSESWRYGTSQALPGGTALHDLLLVGVTGTDPEATNLTDPRMTLRWTSDAYGSAWGTTYTSVYTGKADDLSAVTFPEVTGLGFDRVGLLLAFHPDTPIDWDARLAALTVPDHGGSGSIPALGGPGSGAILVVGAGGFIGGAYGTYTWPPGWDHLAQKDNSYQSVQAAMTDDSSPGVLPYVWTDPVDEWVACAVGLGLG